MRLRPPAVEAGEHLMAAGAALLDAAGVGYSMEVVLGEPSTVLVDMAEQLNADLVMLGARGMGAIESVLVGSVSKAVIHRCTRPVLIVREPEQPDADVSEEEDEARVRRSRGLGSLALPALLAVVAAVARM